MYEFLGVFAEGGRADDAEGKFEFVDVGGDDFIPGDCGQADGAVKESGPWAVAVKCGSLQR